MVKLLGTAAEKNSKINMVDVFNFTTFDTIADLSLGQPLGLLETGEYHPWVSNIFGGVKLAVWGGVIAKILGPTLNRIVTNIFLSMFKEQTKKHFRYTGDMVDKRIEQQDKNEKPDIWKYVLDRENEDELTLPEMHSNAATMLVAGSETTATLLSALTYLLLRNPAAYEELKDEVRSNFSAGETMSFTKLRDLEFLNACINEALRVFPPAPGGLPRIVPGGGAQVCGDFIPEGTTVYYSHLAAYTHPSNFVDAASFLPERWLSNDPRYKSDNRSALQPFSVGPRNCIGKPLAWHEMRLVLAKTILNFELELMPESDGFLKQKIFLTWEKKPLWVRVRSPKGA